MNKSSSNYEDEIDFSAIFEKLWNGKWKIITTTLLAALVAFLTSFQDKKIMYKVSAPLTYGMPSTFIELIEVNDILKDYGFYSTETNPNGYKIDAFSIFDMFVYEFNDYDELMDVLKESNFVKESLKGLDEEIRNKNIIEYSRLFGISLNNNKWVLFFDWHDVNEGRQLMNNAIFLTLNKIKKNIIDDLRKLSNFIDAKNNSDLDVYKIKLNLLEQEITLMDDLATQGQLLITREYFGLKEKVLLLEKELSSSRFKKSLKAIENSNPKEWIKYDHSFPNSKSYFNEKSFSIWSIILAGIAIGVVYVFISDNLIRNKKHKVVE